MTLINGIDVEVVKQTAAAMAADPAAAKKENVIEGRWESKEAVFRSTIETPQGSVTLSAAVPPFLGGRGQGPGALHFCLFGSAACYVGTLVAVAAEEGIDLGEVTVRIANKVNFRPVLGIASEPTVEGVTIEVNCSAAIPEQTLHRLKVKTDAQCPGMYCLTQPIPVTTRVTTA